MHEQYGDQVNFIGMAGRDDLEPIGLFIAERGVGGFQHTVDEDGSVWESYGIQSQPAFVFINDDGTTETIQGAMGEAGLTERLESLLAS